MAGDLETTTPASATEGHTEEAPQAASKPYEEFEVGEHQVPWFLWLFFLLILVWAAVSWYPFVGY